MDRRTAQIVQNGWKRTQIFSLRRKYTPNVCLRRKEAQIFACGADFPPLKSRLHIHWTPPTRADARLVPALMSAGGAQC
eukprot:2947446-Prymnesium_polylepis.1